MKFEVITEYPVASDSPDTTRPNGAAHDNSGNVEFIKLVEAHFAGRQLTATDWGCSGGLLVRQWAERGHESVGLEGSPYSKERGRAEWATIPERLFTCDISRPFQILADGQAFLTDVITMWETCEHIPEDRLPTLLDNVRKHLKKGGLVLASIPPTPDPPWHQTMKPRPWWEETFAAHGFEVSPEGLAILARERVRGEVETAYAFRLKM